MRWFLMCFFILAGGVQAAEIVHSLDQVPSALKTPEGKVAVAAQLAGKAAPDALGLHLPAPLTAAALAALVLPPGSKVPLNAVGAKPLASQPGAYIAIICTGGDVPTRADDTACADTSDDGKPKLQAWLALVEAKGDAPLRLIAKPLLVDGAVDWGHTNLPAAPEAADEANGAPIAPAKFEGFDLAPYKIAADQPAYGLRGAWSDGYSGGFADYKALYLFAVEDGALKRVLAVPMSAYKMIAGDWHKDGTRDHEVTDAANVLAVSPHSTNGHFDLTLRGRDKHFEQTFRWDTATGGYGAAKK